MLVSRSTKTDIFPIWSTQEILVPYWLSDLRQRLSQCRFATWAAVQRQLMLWKVARACPKCRATTWPTLCHAHPPDSGERDGALVSAQHRHIERLESRGQRGCSSGGAGRPSSTYTPLQPRPSAGAKRQQPFPLRVLLRHSLARPVQRLVPGGAVPGDT